MTPRNHTLPSRANPNSRPADRRWLWAVVCVAGGVLGLAALYAGALAEPYQAMLRDIELGSFEAFNASMGRNAAWDWTVIVGASPFWVMAALAVVVLGSLWEGWRERHHDYGRVFGYIVFVAVAALVTLEAADYIADNIERRLPWRREVLQAMIARYDADFLEYDAKAGVLNDIVAVWVMILVTIAGRLPRTALAGTALLMAHVFASLTLGSQWLLGQMAGVCFGGAFGGAAMLAGRRPLAWAERKASTLFLSRFWHSLYHDALNRPGRIGAHALTIEQLSELKPRKLPRRERFWRRLVEREVLPVLNRLGVPFTLSRTPPGPPQPGFRASRRVRFLTITGSEGDEHFVVRAVWRWGGMLAPSSKFRRYSGSARCNLYLERLGMPVARVHWVHETLTAAGLRSVGFYVEQLLSGRPVDVDNPAELRQAAALIARLHGHTSAQWGAVADLASRAPSQYILQFLRADVMYFLRKAGQWLDIDFTREETDRIWKHFETEALALLSHEPPPFRLTHGDVTFRNILIGDNDAAWLVDFGGVSYDFAGWEIVKTAVALGRRRLGPSRDVWRAYFEAAGEGRWREFRREARLGLARFALRELAQKRALAAAPAGARMREAVLVWLEDLFVRTDGWWGERPEDTQWEALLSFLAYKPVAGLAAPSGADADGE